MVAAASDLADWFFLIEQNEEAELQKNRNKEIVENQKAVIEEGFVKNLAGLIVFQQEILKADSISKFPHYPGETVKKEVFEKNKL